MMHSTVKRRILLFWPSVYSVLAHWQLTFFSIIFLENIPNRDLKKKSLSIFFALLMWTDKTALRKHRELVLARLFILYYLITTLLLIILKSNLVIFSVFSLPCFSFSFLFLSTVHLHNPCSLASNTGFDDMLMYFVCAIFYSVIHPHNTSLPCLSFLVFLQDIIISSPSFNFAVILVLWEELCHSLFCKMCMLIMFKCYASLPTYWISMFQMCYHLHGDLDMCELFVQIWHNLVGRLIKGIFVFILVLHVGQFICALGVNFPLICTILTPTIVQENCIVFTNGNSQIFLH